MRALLVLLALTSSAGCLSARPQGGTPGPADTSRVQPVPTTSTTPGPTSTPPPSPAPLPPDTTVAPAPFAAVEVRYRVERHTTDAATAGFEAIVEATLSDPRGWTRAGFTITRTAAAPYLVVLAEPDEAQIRCLPYDVYRRYSCQNGPEVVLNAERWRHATPEWTGDLATYRAMLVNHEFGHLLGMRHPRSHCPQPGRPAPIMGQQSTELNGCLPNPWPLHDEIARAARHDQPLAPPPAR